jgi:uncharacterized protein HemX
MNLKGVIKKQEARILELRREVAAKEAEMTELQNAVRNIENRYRNTYVPDYIRRDYDWKMQQYNSI